MIINIISVGKLSPGYRGLADHYCKMIKWKIKETELNYTPVRDKDCINI